MSALTLVKSFTEKLANFNKEKQKLYQQLKFEFPTLLQDLFDKSERIESISWTQYTPYFNDGDECIFGVYSDELGVNEDRGFDLSENHWSRKGFYINQDNRYIVTPNPNYDEYETSILKEMTARLQSIPEELFRYMFEDHCKVTIYKDGRIETDYYEHD